MIGEHTGTGLFALTTMNPVTIGVGYFNQTNLNQSTDINSSSLFGARGLNKALLDIVGDSVSNGNNIGSKDLYVGTISADLSPIKLEAWYIDLADTLDSFTLVASANFKPSENSKLGFEARYVNLSLDNPDLVLESGDNSLLKLTVSGSVGIVNAKATYAQTGKDGGLTAFDVDSQNTVVLWNLSTNGVPDAKYWDFGVGVNLLDNIELSGYYASIESDGGDYDTLENYEGEEYYAQLTYKMSKNLKTYLRYGNLNEDLDKQTRDQNIGRWQVEYSF